jgi:hypothetical protein
MIVVIFDGEGGELCIQEPGIVLNLRNGDAVLFSSSSITHFNLNHKGRCTSLVFHSAGLSLIPPGVQVESRWNTTKISLNTHATRLH